MTEFTKEYIRSVRMCSYLMEPPASEVIEHLCDEIERLQQRIAELEQERDYLDTKCAAFENDFVLLDVTEKLKKAEKRIAELEIQLKSKDIIINNQQGRLNFYATKDLLGGKR